MTKITWFSVLKETTTFTLRTMKSPYIYSVDKMQLFIVKAGGAYSYRWVLKGYAYHENPLRNAVEPGSQFTD
jgi:hypothetical protein